MPDVVILDCYTDEPSGYGVRPYLGTHQLHLSQALAAAGVAHAYLTIDDLRYCKTGTTQGPDTDLSTINTTLNRDSAIALLYEASLIYVIMGCFVDYSYFSCVPPTSDEVYEFMKDTPGRKVLFYVMGTLDGIAPEFTKSKLRTIIDDVEHGNTYRYGEAGRASTRENNLINPDYELLSRIGSIAPPIVAQLGRPVIAEIETGTGCNTPTCSFCIESVRSPRVMYREPADIVEQIGSLYDVGVRHFRLGRQPNFFHYQKQNVSAMERLLEGIRTRCPALRVLHIDNVNIVNVITPAGRRIAQLVARYCTSGNVAPFGIESFDPVVRQATGVVGSPEDVIAAIEILNECGSRRGPDGLPTFLPGVNIIHGLPGARTETHEINLSYLQQILDRGLMTYRLYYRKITSATGVSLQSARRPPDLEYEQCFGDVVRQYVMPMQERVYPRGTVISGDWEAVSTAGRVVARTIGTCSIKVVLAGADPGWSEGLSVRVIDNIGYRLIGGTVA